VNLVFANPPGFWALLGIPVLLLIHFLQRETRREPCTTLFLLDALSRESASGHRIERLRQSIPLWLQLAAVLLLTWLLVEPRRLRPGAVQPVAFVLDSSASMRAFTEETRRALLREALALARSAAHTEFLLLESTLGGPALHRGDNAEQLAAALDTWTPAAGRHDFAPALRVARNAVGRQGEVLFLTDHLLEEVPSGARVLAVGSPTSNAGFAGARVERTERGPVWRALVRNYAAEPLDREWFLTVDGQPSPPQSLRLEAGELRTLSGSFPAEADSFVLHLEGDAFPLDDSLPVLVPRRRRLDVGFAVSGRARPAVEDWLAAFAPAEASPPSAEMGPDFLVYGYDPLDPTWPDRPAVIFVDRPSRGNRVEAGEIVPSDHPLMDELRWEALTIRAGVGIPFREGDTALLWRGEEPLIWLRDLPAEPRPQLVFNFDPFSSNATRLPAFVLLLHRYAEQIRQTKIALEHRLVETGQVIALPDHLEPDAISARFRSLQGTESVLPAFSAGDHRLTLPDEPGFVTITWRDQPLLRLASHFADTRESNLLEAASTDATTDRSLAQMERYTVRDPNWTLWTLLLGGVLVVSWAWLGREPAASRGLTGPPRSKV